jgi:outer membrane lipoprotein-sorting protein
MRTLYKPYASNPLQPFWRGILKYSGGLISIFMRRNPPFWALLVTLAVLPTAGCVFRTRPVEEQYSKTPLKESSQRGLIDSINQQAETIHSLKATVDIDTSSGGIKKGSETQYKEIRGYVLARKPNSLHMIGLMPIVRTTAFDMVSDGQDFKLWIPPKNRFVVGKNEVATPNTDQPMENIRPQNIYEALLIRHIDPESDIAVLENGYETLHDSKGHRVLQEDYELVVIRKFAKGWGLSRRIIFGRADLKPHRQYIYDEDGKLATDARYAEYKDFSGVSFPSRIEIYRPQEEYDITLNMLKVDINQPLTDDQFVLEQPAGAEVIHLDRPQSSLAKPILRDANSR